MSTLFDTQVNNRRKHTPWAKIDLMAFVYDMLWHEAADGKPSDVTLTVSTRPDVASRLWFRLEFVDGREHRRMAEAQKLDLCLWRAVQMAISAASELEAKDVRDHRGKEIDSEYGKVIVQSMLWDHDIERYVAACLTTDGTRVYVDWGKEL